MTRFLFCCVASFLVTSALADDATKAAIKKDYEQLAGTWRVVAVVLDGEKLAEQDARKFTVVNGADGTWSLRESGKEIDKGTSTIDPSKSPKAIDLTPLTGEAKDKVHLAIYELGDKTRRLCISGPNNARPKDFTSDAGTGQVLVTLEREAAK